MSKSIIQRIIAIPNGGAWAAPSGARREPLERAAESAALKTGRLFAVRSSDDGYQVEDITGHFAAPDRKHYKGKRSVSGSIRGVLTRSVVTELGGPEGCRALVRKYLGGKPA
jgi:hypothetical protein